MNVLNKLTMKNLKLNKKRTISTIIGIILASALICAVATMVTSFQATLVQNAINETGYYHIKIFNIDDEDISKLKSNRNVKDVYTEINENEKEVCVVLKNPKQHKTAIANILGTGNYEKFELNNELLRWEAMAFSDTTVSMIYAIAGVVIFIIIFTSVFCIRNSFAIAITEKQKMYGMLSTVGATKKQIKKNVIFEAFILGIIGIPLGILSGIFAVFVLLKIVNSLLGEFLLGHIEGIIMKVSIIPILLTILLGIITIYLSAISSARRASKINPIDLIRNSQEIKIKSKKLKTSKIISKLFKIGGVLAYKNLKRSKKKYKTTVISLAVSISIFIAMNTLIVNMFDLTNNYYEDYDYNMIVYLREQSQETINKLKDAKNVEEYFILHQSNDSLIISDLNKINKLDDDEEKSSALNVVALDDSTFKKYTKKAGINYEKVKNKGILCDKYLDYDEVTEKQYENRRYNYSVGETIIGKYKNKETTIQVGAISSVKPYGIENSYYVGGYLVVNLDQCKNIKFEPIYMLIQSNDTKALINEMQNNGIDAGYADFAEAAREQKAMVLVVKIFLYGFITVITLIGVTNIFNTITSNIELRQKEFAMLKSIGMTRKEFNGMINLETIFYSAKSLLYGIALGLLGSFAMYKAFSVKIEQGVYIPIKPIIISIIAVFVLVFIIMRYSINKINKQNTIETIRNDNI